MLKVQTEREFYQNLGKFIRRVRRRSGMSPFYAGRTVGINGTMFYAMEKGDVVPTPYQIYKIICTWWPEYLRQIERDNKI